MGLDIYVKKVIPLGNKSIENIDSYFSLNDYPKLKIFEKMSFNKKIESYDLPKNSTVLSSIHDRYGNISIKIQKGNNKISTINNPTTILKEVKVILTEEVGYQRKGANSQFYEDDIWGDEEKGIVIDVNYLTHKGMRLASKLR